MSWLRRNPYAPYAASNPLRVRFGGGHGLKIAVAFVGGVCCASVVVGAWGAIHPHASQRAASADVRSISAHSAAATPKQAAPDAAAVPTQATAAPQTEGLAGSPIPLPPIRPTQTLAAAAQAPISAAKRAAVKPARPAKLARAQPLNIGSIAAAPRSDKKARSLAPQNLDNAEPDADANGRHVVVEETYRLGDGRRVAVIRTYPRAGARPGVHERADRSLRDYDAYADDDDADSAVDDDIAVVPARRALPFPLDLLPHD